MTITMRKEMEIVVKAVCEGYKVVAAPIATIYEKDNCSSHFNKVWDSVRIYRRLVAAVLRSRRKAAVAGRGRTNG